MKDDIDKNIELESLKITPQKVFSEAYNLSGLTSSVNNRTGSFQATIGLGKITSGIQCPIDFNLTLLVGAPNHFYPEFQEVEDPVKYFGFNIPRLELLPWSNKVRVYSSSGSVGEAVVSQVNGKYEFEMVYHKTKDMLIEAVAQVPFPGSQHDFKYQVSYKDGNVEYYNEQGRLERIVSSSGNSLVFSYSFDYLDVSTSQGEIVNVF